MKNSNHKNATRTLQGKCRKYASIKKSKRNLNFKLKQGTKKHNIAKLFCLDHAKLGETCLHSTVSGLSKRFGLTIPRQWIKLPNRNGQLVSVKQYWFSDDDIAKIKPLLEEVDE